MEDVADLANFSQFLSSLSIYRVDGGVDFVYNRFTCIIAVADVMDQFDLLVQRQILLGC